MLLLPASTAYAGVVPVWDADFHIHDRTLARSGRFQTLSQFQYEVFSQNRKSPRRRLGGIHIVRHSRSSIPLGVSRLVRQRVTSLEHPDHRPLDLICCEPRPTQVFDVQHICNVFTKTNRRHHPKRVELPCRDVFQKIHLHRFVGQDGSSLSAFSLNRCDIIQYEMKEVRVKGRGIYLT